MSDERSKVRHWKHKCAEKESSENCDSDTAQAGSPPPAMSTSRGSVKRAAAVAANTKLKMSKSSLYEKAYKEEDFKRKATETVKAEEFESLSSPIKGQEEKVLEQTTAALDKTSAMAKIGAQKRAVIESDGSSSDGVDGLEVSEEVKTGVLVSSDDDMAASEEKPSKRIVESDSDKENSVPVTSKELIVEAEKKELAPTPAVKEKAEEEVVYEDLPADVKEKAEEVVKQVFDEVAMSDLAVDDRVEELLMYESSSIVVKALLAKKNDAEGVAAHIVDQMESVGEGHLSLGLLELVRETVVNCLKGIDGGDVWLPEDEEEATKSEGSSAEAEAKKADDENSEK